VEYLTGLLGRGSGDAAQTDGDEQGRAVASIWTHVSATAAARCRVVREGQRQEAIVERHPGFASVRGPELRRESRIRRIIGGGWRKTGQESHCVTGRDRSVVWVWDCSNAGEGKESWKRGAARNQKPDWERNAPVKCAAKKPSQGTRRRGNGPSCGSCCRGRSLSSEGDDRRRREEPGDSDGDREVTGQVLTTGLIGARGRALWA